MSESYDINAQPITVEDLEARMVCFHDIKKAHAYDKHTGKWGWCDRGEQEAACGFERFDTFWEMILDATEPYFDHDDE